MKNIKMADKKSVALIICYFGKMPWYFNYFVHSCEYNPSVDFYIITDNADSRDRKMPNNIKLIYKTLREVSLMAAEKLGFEVNISYGYKLCDFKPAYGFIFSDLLKGYDFWGHCDLDIIFGNIGNFITDELLDNFELISVRHDWLSGCFLLYKNNAKLNTLFLHSKDYKKVFSSDKHYCFDETNFAHHAFTEGKSYREVDTEIESMTHVVKKLESENFIKPFFDFYIIEGRPGKLRWENGKMFYRNKYEILFYHLIYFKNKYLPKKTDIDIPDGFTISPTKINHNKKPKLVIDEF